MSLFHDEEDGDGEPVRGLPAALPEDERLLWQGRPDARAFAIHVFHIRFIAGYFVLLLAWRLASLSAAGAPMEAFVDAASFTALTGVAATAIFAGIAWLMARSTIYTITDKRIVLRYGVAIRKYVNLPFSRIGAVAMRRHSAKGGSIALQTGDQAGLGYLRLWPHARPMRFSSPQPMLRALSDVDAAAETLIKAMKQHAPDHVRLGGETAPSTVRPMPATSSAAAAI